MDLLRPGGPGTCRCAVLTSNAAQSVILVVDATFIRTTRMKARARLLLAFALLGFTALIVVVVLLAGGDRSSRRPWIFEVEMQASSGTLTQLFWSADQHFAEERSARVQLQPAGDGFQQLRFLLPSQGVRWLRFDPIDAPGEVLIRRMQLLDSERRILREFTSESLAPVSQIGSLVRQGDVTRLVTTPAGTDPYIYLPLGCLDSHSVRDTLSLVSTPALALASLAAALLLGACVAVIGVDAFGGQARVSAPPPYGASWWLPVLWMAVLFLTVFSAKLLLMRQNPVTVPFWDQWDGEARVLYLPFNECTLPWSQMFSLHNEHRVFFSRLLALDLLIINGQWDPRLQQVVNAALHALTGLLLVAMLWVANERRRLDLLVFVGALTFSLPFSWENTLVGFQSAFYFLLLFSILGLWLTTRYRAGMGAWCLGWLCALCGLFTAAGGVLLPLVLAGVAVLKLAHDWRAWRAALLSLVTAASVLAVGVLTASPPLPHHAGLKARSVAEFATAIGRNLAWPWLGHPQLSFLLWLPVGALLLLVLIRPARATVREWFIVALGSWVLLQAAAVAYGRGAGAGIPPSRYQDFLSLGFVANTMALVLVCERIPSGTIWRPAAPAALAGWLLFSTVGVDRLLNGTLVHLNAWRPYWTAQASNVRRFIITSDLAAFTSKRPLEELPYPDPLSLANLLQEPYIRRILPAAVRAPVRVEPQVPDEQRFRL